MAKAPCKYGPRTADGKCPRAPCKYGPRDADGYCPKRPTSASPTTPGRTGATPAPCKYGPRITDPVTGKLRCPKASERPVTQQLAEGVQKAAVYSVTKTAENAATDMIAAYKKDPVQFKGAARDVLVLLLTRLALPATLAIGAAYLGILWSSKYGTTKAMRDRGVKVLTDATLAKTIRDYTARGFKWDSAWDATLRRQYTDWYTKQLAAIGNWGTPDDYRRAFSGG